MSYFRSIYAAPPDELPHRARAVYMYLKDRAGKGQDCWPAVNTIAANLQLSRSTVKRAIADLEKSGYLRREQRWRENGGKSSNMFYLTKADSS